MRVVGVDFGARRIGLAVGDSEARLASPRPALVATGTLARDADAIAALARREEATGVVVGLPLDDRGEETRLSRVCRQLGERLVERGLVVHFADETLTSHEAHGRLEGQGLSVAATRRRIDSEAACQILERWWSGAG